MQGTYSPWSQSAPHIYVSHGFMVTTYGRSRAALLCETRQEQLAIGETPNIAECLVEIPTPNTLRCKVTSLCGAADRVVLFRWETGTLCVVPDIPGVYNSL